MDIQWYYVVEKERKGPVAISDIKQLLSSGQLNDQSYVWTKGFDNWKRVSEISELNESEVPVIENELPPRLVLEPATLSDEDKVISLKIGMDRGNASETEYGPFTLLELKRLWEEKRISAKTLYYVPGMSNWEFVGDSPFFERIAGGLPPAIEEKDRRVNLRKPFVARILLHNSKEAIEGVCKDVSLGGLQILVYGAPCKIDEKVLLNVHPDNSDFCFTAEGRVVRILEGGTGFSLEFINLKDEAKNSIKSYLQSQHA